MKPALLTGAVLLMVCTLGVVALRFTGYSLTGPVDTGCPPDVPTCVETVTAPAAREFTGPDGSVDDPTSRGRITQRMLHADRQARRAIGRLPGGVRCWDEHAWNPSSDHPRGRACDYAVGTLGRFPRAGQQREGWRLARWFQVNAEALGVRYIIWDGRIWSTWRSRDGWRGYDGAGVYDPRTPTGGHFDHVHVSVE